MIEPAGHSAPSAHRLDADTLAGSIDLVCHRPLDRPVRGILIWCHGLGGSNQQVAALAATWAASGFYVVTPTFADSIALVAERHPELGIDPAPGERWAADEHVRSFMLTNMLDWPWRADRLAVVGAVLDALPELIAVDLPAGTGADSSAVGLGGHSFGAYVSQLLAGARIDCPLGDRTSFRDERVIAAVIASGQGRNQAGLLDGSWADVTVPLLNITGTRDGGATTDDPAWKREPFRFGPPGAKYQLVIDGADHGLGGVSGSSDLYPGVARHLAMVERISTEFWGAFVAGDPEARARLDSDRPATWFGDDAEYRRR